MEYYNFNALEEMADDVVNSMSKTYHQKMINQKRKRKRKSLIKI